MSVAGSEQNIYLRKQIVDMYERYYFPRLRELTGMFDADVEILFLVMDYLMWADKNSLDLKFNLT